MEERLPPNDDNGATVANNDNNLPLVLFTGPKESSETYIVQIPRDQVYRVPPPEHARIVENYHKRNPPKNKKRCGCILVWTIIPLVLLGVLAGIAVLVLRATLYSPRPPEFSVAHIRSKNPNPPEYDVVLRASYPKARMWIFYRGPGDASLVFMKQKLGQGVFPESQVKDNPNANVDISIVLSGKGINVPAEIKKGLNDPKEVKAMILTIAVPIEVKSWVRNEKRDLNIACDFKVHGSLMEKSTAANKVTSQECRSDF